MEGGVEGESGGVITVVYWAQHHYWESLHLHLLCELTHMGEKKEELQSWQYYEAWTLKTNPTEKAELPTQAPLEKILIPSFKSLLIKWISKLVKYLRSTN